MAISHLRPKILLWGLRYHRLWIDSYALKTKDLGLKILEAELHLLLGKPEETKLIEHLKQAPIPARV